MKPGYLIYHPKRCRTTVGNITIYHDDLRDNEDPYVWNRQFLHTYCHITQLSNEVGQVNFWISGDRWPLFTRLYCDCVFVIESKHYWTTANFIDRADAIIENDQAFAHHYDAVNKKAHQLKRRRRYTLKADAARSFQPQHPDHSLIDILPFLNDQKLSKELLQNALKSNFGSRPINYQLD